VTDGEPHDPVIRSRERIRMLAGAGRRCGYSCFLTALAAFLINYYSGSSSFWISFTVALLIIGSLVLAPSIIFGYAVNAAEREEQGLPHGH
jgi:sugar phosphate permease